MKKPVRKVEDKRRSLEPSELEKIRGGGSGVVAEDDWETPVAAAGKLWDDDWLAPV